MEDYLKVYSKEEKGAGTERVFEDIISPLDGCIIVLKKIDINVQRMKRWLSDSKNFTPQKKKKLIKGAKKMDQINSAMILALRTVRNLNRI